MVLECEKKIVSKVEKEVFSQRIWSDKKVFQHCFNGGRKRVFQR